MNAASSIECWPAVSEGSCAEHSKDVPLPVAGISLQHATVAIHIRGKIERRDLCGAFRLLDPADSLASGDRGPPAPDPGGG